MSKYVSTEKKCCYSVGLATQGAKASVLSFTEYSGFQTRQVETRENVAVYRAIILGMGSANERRHYNAMSSLIGWAHTQNDP